MLKFDKVSDEVCIDFGDLRAEAREDVEVRHAVLRAGVVMRSCGWMEFSVCIQFWPFAKGCG
jgi:hypothetical protein